MSCKFYRCECGNEIIGVTQDDELLTIELSIFQLAYKPINLNSLKEKLRLCWHILTKGNLWTDTIILDSKASKELGEDLIELSKTKVKEGR